MIFQYYTLFFGWIMIGPRWWLPWEKRYLHALLQAILPAASPFPGLLELDLAPFWKLFHQSAPFSLRWGLRGMVWLFCFHSWLQYRGSFVNLNPQKQLLLLEQFHEHPQRRLIIESLKVIACLAYFHDPQIQQKVREP